MISGSIRYIGRDHASTIRDAQGNIMATYRYTNTGPASLKLNERPIYGSSRLGSLRAEMELHSMPAFNPQNANPVQQVDLNYELTDHLGNVCAVVTGRLLHGNGGGTPKQAELLSAQGYEPFGSLLPGRNYSNDSYRFGWNTQEKVDEVNGSVGTHLTAQFWEYDTRTGRRWNLDPKPQISLSDYSVMGGNPIWHTDPLGDLFKVKTGDAQAQKDVKSLAKKKNQDYIKFEEDGTAKLDFGDMKQKKIDKIIKRDAGLSLVNDLITAKKEDGTDYNFFYSTKGPLEIRDRSDGYIINAPFPAHPPGFETQRADFFMNASTTKYSDAIPYYLPREGMDGQVAIAPGTVYSKVQTRAGEIVMQAPRSRLVYHELRENFLRTTLRMQYEEAHSKAGGLSEIWKFVFE